MFLLGYIHLLFIHLATSANKPSSMIQYTTYLLSYFPPPITVKFFELFACSIYDVMRLNALSSMTAEVKQSNSVGLPTFSLDRSARRPALICKKEITQDHTTNYWPCLMFITSFLYQKFSLSNPLRNAACTTTNIHSNGMCPSAIQVYTMQFK